MPKARKTLKPTEHPMWDHFEDYLRRTRGGVGDNWQVQWDVFVFGLHLGGMEGVRVAVQMVGKELIKQLKLK